MSQEMKILVCGDVKGRFSQLFTKVNNIVKKTGSYDILICVGDFFGDDETTLEMLKSSKLKPPLPIIFLGPNKTEHEKFFLSLDGFELCENAISLGRRGIYNCKSGLTIAYLSGVERAGFSNSGVNFDPEDVIYFQELMSSSSNFKGVDLLLTSQWPEGTEKYGNNIEGDAKVVGSQLISQLAICLKPRYHFSALEGVYYERRPYRNHQVLNENAQHVTRFIALSDEIANPSKNKFLYAFKIVPMKNMDVNDLVKQPPDVTECPYKTNPSAFSKSSSKEEKSSQFFYDPEALKRGTASQRGKRRAPGDNGEPQKKRAQPSGPCWFCLGSPEVEKHLVVSVGQECYVALAKGGLTPDHILVIPVGHEQSLVSAPNDILIELDKYKAALKKYFISVGKSVVFFERNYKTSHLQLQVVPLPEKDSTIIKDEIIKYGASQQVDLQEIPRHTDLKQVLKPGMPYFYAELPDGTKLLFRISKGFPLQFGREALTQPSLLDMLPRADWKNCKVSKESEVKFAEEFRQKFQRFDFSLQ